MFLVRYLSVAFFVCLTVLIVVWLIDSDNLCVVRLGKPFLWLSKCPMQLWQNAKRKQMYVSYCGWSCFFKHKFDKLAPASWCDSVQHRTIQNFSCRLSNFSPLKSAAYVVQWICRIHYQWSTIKNIHSQYYIWGNFGDCSLWGDKLIKKSRKHFCSNPAHLNNCDVPLNIFYSSLIKNMNSRIVLSENRGKWCL